MKKTKILSNYKIENSVRLWVETIVVDLNLCPFAKRELVKNSVRFSVSEAKTEEQLLVDLHAELDLLTQDDAIETALLIHPNVLQDFYVYNQFLSYADDLLQQLILVGVYQIASFHPQYQFAGTHVEDVENYTNKSPYPILHIIREASLDIAIDSHPDTTAIPIRNKQFMRDMGSSKMKALLRACLLT